MSLCVNRSDRKCEPTLRCVPGNIRDAGGSNTDLYGEERLSTKVHLIVPSIQC